MRIAVIPARGGSKRIPRKNIKDFGGQPMIAWSLKAAHQSDCFDRVIVSTDDSEIAEVAMMHGGEVPFLRPPELANDHCGTAPVIAHAIRWANGEGLAPTEICCIYATAPFILASNIREGLELLNSSKANYAFSVTSYTFPIQRALRITPDRQVEMFEPLHAATRSQDLEEAWHDAGQFYWGRAEAWLTNAPLFARGSVPVILPRHRVQDIDTPEDWEYAELMFRALGDGASVAPA